MIWQIVVKSILLCIVWQTNSGLFDVFLSLSQIDGVLRFYALHTRGFHKYPVQSTFCFVFCQSDQKTKKKSAVLFAYFLYKKSAFCLKMTADFFVFGHFD